MRVLLSLSLLLSSTAALAATPLAAPPAGPYKQGQHYQVVLPAQPVSTKPGQVVVLVRVPAILQPEWEAGARAYYVAQALGILDKSHKATFDEIHQAKDNLQ